MNFIGIIPARYGSTRFPGKPLAILGGKPVIQHVYERACLALDTVVVATDDERIAHCVRSFGGEVIMTSSECNNGTERCAKAMHSLLPLLGKECLEDDIVTINIQGDEPFIQPEQIEAVKALFAESKTDIGTLATPIHDAEVLYNPNCVKVVLSPEEEHYRAIYFSRSPIPYLRGVAEEEWIDKGMHYKHVGLYAYRAKVLRDIVQLPPSPLEIAESLEQLRWMEAGYQIAVALTNTETIGIDTPEDLSRAEEQIADKR